MRILVTRPQPAAEATADRLRSLGHEAVVVSILRAEHDGAAVARALADPFDALALTSAEAVRAFSHQPPVAKAHRDKPVFCVGPATAQAAKACGFSNVVSGKGTGLSLAHLVVSTMPAGARLLYLAGRPRRPDFEAAMTEAGQSILAVDCYRMVPVEGAKERLADVLATFMPDAVLLYSVETTRLFLDLAGSIAPSLRLLCLSRAISDCIPSGTGTVIVADRPDEDSLLAQIRS